MESEYTKYFDSIAKECDMSEISEHSLGAIFWDKQQQKINKLEEENEKLKSLLKKYYTDEEMFNAEFAYMENDLGFNEMGFGEN